MKLYRELAEYYDLIYHDKDYEKEAEKVIDLIKKYKKSDGKDLLELGCGTGKHLKYFKKFNCLGTDVNEDILKIAKGLKVKKANMINFNLNKKFDIIISMFSSIGYVKTYENLEKTFKSISKHLKKGGVVIIEPWFTQEEFESGRIRIDNYEDEKIKISRMSTTRKKGNISILEMQFLVGKKGKIKHFKDIHELGLFSIEKTLKLMEKAGLKAKFLKTALDRGAFIGVK